MGALNEQAALNKHLFTGGMREQYPLGYCLKVFNVTGPQQYEKESETCVTPELPQLLSEARQWYFVSACLHVREDLEPHVPKVRAC